MRNKIAKAWGWMKSNPQFVVPGMAVAVWISTSAFAPAVGVLTPSLDLSVPMSTALDTIFYYAVMIFTALIGIAGIGIGFQFGGGLIRFVGDMISKSLHF